MCFASGSTVTVFNQKLSGEPIIEGRAKIVKSTNVDGQYAVRFIDSQDRGTYNRFVYGGECQRDPQGYLAKARAEWEAGTRDHSDRIAALQNERSTGLLASVERDMARLGL